jgi:hypothetical protein
MGVIKRLKARRSERRDRKAAEVRAREERESKKRQEAGQRRVADRQAFIRDKSADAARLRTDSRSGDARDASGSTERAGELGEDR